MADLRLGSYVERGPRTVGEKFGPHSECWPRMEGLKCRPPTGRRPRAVDSKHKLHAERGSHMLGWRRGRFGLISGHGSHTIG